MDTLAVSIFLIEDFMNCSNENVLIWIAENNILKIPLEYFITNRLTNIITKENENEVWLDKYNEIVFYRLFRMQKQTFNYLLRTVLEKDRYNLLQKQYRGGHFPLSQEKSLLVFLWYMATQDSLQTIGQIFHITMSTVMKVVNVVLYIVVNMKSEYISWPKTAQEIRHVTQGFPRYPGTLGALDGSHVEIKVPLNQQDSYVNRFQSYSVNLMGITTADKIFTYAYIGFPGSAHDSRVFSNSLFVQNIERYGPGMYFPNEDYHIIGDSAFPIKIWLMTPYRRNAHLGRVEKYHNYCLSSDRVIVENTFGIVKGRWRRLLYINTYSVSKSIEIITSACVLHNFCYLHSDEWTDIIHEQWQHEDFVDNNLQQGRLGQAKRDRIARHLFNNRQ